MTRNIEDTGSALPKQNALSESEMSLGERDALLDSDHSSELLALNESVQKNYSLSATNEYGDSTTLEAVGATLSQNGQTFTLNVPDIDSATLPLTVAFEPKFSGSYTFNITTGKGGVQRTKVGATYSGSIEFTIDTNGSVSYMKSEFMTIGSPPKPKSKPEPRTPAPEKVDKEPAKSVPLSPEQKEVLKSEYYLQVSSSTGMTLDADTLGFTIEPTSANGVDLLIQKDRLMYLPLDVVFGRDENKNYSVTIKFVDADGGESTVGTLPKDEALQFYVMSDSKIEFRSR